MDEIEEKICKDCGISSNDKKFRIKKYRQNKKGELCNKYYYCNLCTDCENFYNFKDTICEKCNISSTECIFKHYKYNRIVTLQFVTSIRSQSV